VIGTPVWLRIRSETRPPFWAGSRRANELDNARTFADKTRKAAAERALEQPR
jgi:hypothetical protein